MKTYLIKKHPQDLDFEDYKKCYSLNFRDEGYMRPNLSFLRKNKKREDRACAFILKNNEGLILAWALYIHKTTEYACRNEIHFYTRKSMRKKGFAHILAEHVIAYTNKYDLPRPKVDKTAKFLLDSF